MFDKEEEFIKSLDIEQYENYENLKPEFYNNLKPLVDLKMT